MIDPAESEIFDVRRLCRKPQLVVPTVRPAASPHLLAPWIKSSHKYKVGQKVARLPTSREGLVDLDAVIKRPIEHLNEIYREPAWRALLVGSPLRTKLPDPDPAALAMRYGLGELVNVRPGQLRVLALAAVVHPPGILRTENSVVREVPLAAVGRLILLTRGPARADVTQRAWLRVAWTTTTRTFCRELEEIFLAAGDTARGPDRLKHAVLLAPEFGNHVTDQRLYAAAAILGFSLTVISGHRLRSEAPTLVKQRRPSVLMVGESVVQYADDALMAAHNNGREPTVLPDTSSELLTEEVRQRLTAEAWLTPALMCMPAPDLEPLDNYKYITKVPLPVKEKGQSRKHRVTKYRYVEDRSNGCWYTSDHSNHSSDRAEAPVLFKRYIARAAGLDWDADLDEHAEEITEKHRGKEYRFIPWKDLDSCQ